jgi:hypothetical protein
MLDMMKGGNDTPAHVNDNLPKAQALKDATMAYSIKEKWSEGKLMIHYNGSYHSRNFEGIIWYLNRYMEGLNIVTIETLSQENIDTLSKENIGAASYIIAVPNNMTTTY